MAAKAKRRKRTKPRFPRRQWRPGQQERVETPKKGKGAYRRSHERRHSDEEAAEAFEEGESESADPEHSDADVPDG